MKILMLHGHYSNTGGAEVVLKHQITRLRQRGHDVLLFCFGDQNIDEKNLVVVKEPQSEFLRYVYQFLINPAGYIRLRKTIRSFSPDVIHLHNIDRHILTFLMPVKNCKAVRSVHDFGMVCPSFWGVHKDDREICDQGIGFKCVRHRCLNPLQYPFYDYLFKIKHYFQKGRVHAYIVATQLMKSYMTSQGFKNVFVSPYFTEKRRDITESSLGRKILFVGSLEKNKGCESLLKAFRIVLQNIPNAELFIAGRGAEEGNLKKISRRLGIGANVHFVGNVPNDKMERYYIDSTVVAVPSLCMDNSPIVIYEAFSFGKPVVASDRGGIPELITNGYNGYLVEAGNPEEMAEAIMKIIGVKNDEFYRTMSRNVLGSSLKYSIDQYIDHLEAVYNKVISA
ncbi:MAG: glycosyltransferase family 4 protein [Smithella sp.]|nr:glycosyltransferase family 4 protein [Smithella sp.]